MSKLHYITGAAGTGKTYELTEALINWLEINTLLDHQLVLAITKMHGARKRLRDRLPQKPFSSKINIATIDSFALQLVNRWRLSLGYALPIQPSKEGGFLRDDFGHQATFDEIMQLASQLTKSPIVVKTIRNTYPIILIDEFQDCDDNQLSLIKNLSSQIDFIIAADPFQSLNGDEGACNWIESIKTLEFVKITFLSVSRRTNCKYINEAASAVRNNQPAKYSETRLPFITTPNYALAAWKVLPKSIQRNETAALIYPAQKALFNLTKSVEDQNKKRAANGAFQNPFPWHSRLPDDILEENLYIDIVDALSNSELQQNEKLKHIHEDARYLSKIKGYKDVIPEAILRHSVRSFIQSRKYVNSPSVRIEATTIHSAKNREFDHVVIFWDDNLCAKFTNDQQRRLIYNAITRAKKSCTLVALGAKSKIMSSSILSLLGEPEDLPKKTIHNKNKTLT